MAMVDAGLSEDEQLARALALSLEGEDCSNAHV